MTWYGEGTRAGFAGSGGGGGGGDSYANTEVRNLRGRWVSFAEWRPDLTQTGFRNALFRFSQVGGDNLVQLTGADFNTGFQHRALLRDITAPTAAAVLREALNSAGDDGNQSLSWATSFEVLAIVRFDAVPPTGGWTLIGGFTSTGAFPFVDVWSLAGQIGIGRTSLATATPAGALEAIATNGTAPANRTRSVLAGALVTGQWLAVSVRYYSAVEPGGARAVMRVRNLFTNVEVSTTLNTTLQAAGAMHVGIIHDVGVATPSGPANISIARLAVGYGA